jgi:hypothetical protein
MTRARPRLLVAALLVLPLLGCSQLPVEGPIVETQITPDVDTIQPLGIDPVPPQPHASRVDIVNGFLDAMTAWPQRLDVAKQFLAADDQGSWNPDQSTVTYSDVGPVTEVGSRVIVELVEPELLDARGAWQGALSADQRVMELQTVQENGEYRIVDPPDRQLVPSDWFADRYRQANVYFFDNSSRILVPEPVFVPRGDQAATTLVARLLAGPADDRIETTQFPDGMTVDLSTPVSDEGVADIRLVGAEPPDSPDAIEKMLAQLAWTLKQEDITALRLTISGQQIRLPGGVSQFDVDSAPEYTPTGYQASYALHGLRDGVLVGGTREELAPVGGPFGVQSYRLRSVTVSIDGETAAGVSSDGRRVLLAPVREPSSDDPFSPEQPPSGVEVAVADAHDLLPPAWDFAGRLWLVDRTDDGAQVSYVERGRARAVRVPGVSGRRVTSFLVSRDGTRLVAVVRARGTGGGATMDELRAGRIEVPANSGTLRALPTARIALGGADPAQIKDIAWTSTTTIAALGILTRDELYSVQTVAVDGAPTDTSPTTINGPVVGLAGTPVPDSRQYAVTPTALIDIRTSTSTFLDDSPISSLGYVG